MFNALFKRGSEKRQADSFSIALHWSMMVLVNARRWVKYSRVFGELFFSVVTWDCIYNYTCFTLIG
jgi:hypothetical protein